MLAYELAENRRLREQQEREYKESMAKDMARIQEKRREQREKEVIEEEKRRQKMAAEQRKEFLLERRAFLQSSSSSEQPKQGQEVVKIQIRFPNGSRLQHSFNADDSLESLFKTAFSHDSCPLYFATFTSFPRTEINCIPEWYHDVMEEELKYEEIEGNEVYKKPRSFRDEGIQGSQVIMVQNCVA